MRWVRDDEFDLWWGDDGQSSATGDSTVLPWGERVPDGRPERLARLVDIDVADRWLDPRNWVAELDEGESHPAAVPPSQRVGETPLAAVDTRRLALYPADGLPPVPALATGHMSAPFPTYPAGLYWPGWDRNLTPLGRWMDQLRPPRTEGFQVDPSRVGAPRWAPLCQRLRLTMPRLGTWAAFGDGPWFAVADGRLLFGSRTPPDEPAWAEVATGRPRRFPRWYTERRVLSTGDPVLTVELNCYPRARTPGAADDYDHHLEQSVAQLVRDIAAQRLSASPPPHSAGVEALEAYATAGLPLPPPVPSGAGKRTVRRAGCTIPDAHMMGLTVPPQRAG